MKCHRAVALYSAAATRIQVAHSGRKPDARIPVSVR